MSKAIDVLMTEHRLIERVLFSLEAYAAELRQGRELERRSAADFAAFFKGYADALHHGKEEDLLFRRMVELGFPEQGGPLAVMLHEHKLGRAHVTAIFQVGAASGPVTGLEQTLVVDNAAGFVPLLRTHILKEDQILYPLALRFLPPDELDRLGERYDAFARQVDDERVNELLGLAERLQAAHPFDPARLAPVSLGCASH